MKYSVWHSGAGASSARRTDGGFRRRIRWPFISGALALLVLLCQSVHLGNVEAQGLSVVEGTIEAYYEDSHNGPRVIHEVNTGTRRHRLQYRKGRRIPEFITGDRVRARGTLSGQGGQVMMLGGGGTEDSGVTTLALASPYTFGPQQTLVILVNFTQDNSQPHTAATAQAVTFTEVNNFYDENSFQQTALNGIVTGWHTINPTATSYNTCDRDDWATKADAAAFNAGVNVLSFPRRIYSFPTNPACSWWGLGTIGGGAPYPLLPSKAWINGEYSVRVLAHELGHNFGAYHSRSRECESGGCASVEYGDSHDIMGNVIGHFNAFQKERFGWLHYESSPPIQTVTDTAEVALESYAAPYGGLPKALKILKSTSGPSNTYIYAEARTQTGFDSGLPAGVIVHTGIDTNGAEGYEIDLDTTSAAEDFILNPGQSFTFTDVDPRITLTTLSSDAGGALLAVVKSASSCTWSLGASSQNFGHGGGSGSVALTTQTGCGWIASSNASWLTVNAGSSNGTQSSTIQFTVAANNTTSPRSGMLTIGGQTFTVTQGGAPCAPTVSPLNPRFTHNGGNGTLTVTAPVGCAWTAAETPDVSWIDITAGTSGNGPGTVTFAVTSHSATSSHNANMTVAGQTVNVYQEGLAALFTSPVQATIDVATSHLFKWTSVPSAQAYELRIGTTLAGFDVFPVTETTLTSRNITNLPPSKMLFARLRTKFGPTTWTVNDIWFTTVDLLTGIQVLGTQTPSPLPAGASAQYGASADASVKVSFTGAVGTCMATLSATGLPSGATATFNPPSLPASAADVFSLLTIGTTPATPSGSYTVTIRAQEDAACGGGLVTTTTNLQIGAVATTVAPAAVNSPYGNSTTLSATLTASGAPVAGSIVAFTVNGTPVGTAITDAAGVASRSNVSLVGINVGTYATGIQASFAGDATHHPSNGSNSLTITTRSVSASVVASDKEYNESGAATITSCTVTPAVSGDAVACTATAASFSSPAAGVGKTVTVVGLALTGASAGNYVLSSTTATTTATINPKPVGPTAAAMSKVYDGTPTAVVSSCTVGPLLPGSRDVVACTGGTATFDSAAAGPSKTVTVSGLTLAGTHAGNYTLTTTTATTTAAITPKSVTLSVTAANKAYDGTAGATLTACVLSGVLGGDVVTCTGTASFDTPAVGAGKTVTASSLLLTGPAAGNYTLASTTATSTAAITARTVTASATVANKEYNGTIAATVTGCTLTGVVEGDVVGCTASAATFNSAAVGTGKAVTVNGLALTGAAAGNYTLASTTATTTAAITAKTTTATVGAANKVYNGMVSAVLTTCTPSGLVGGDVVTCTGTAAFDTANVGTGKTVTVSGLTLSGAAAGNYVLASTTATTTAAITALTVTPTVAASSKPYDGMTGATLTSCTLSGAVGGDVVGCTGSAAFGTPSVGAGKTVTVNGLTLTGPAAGNYTLASTTATTTAAIMAGTVTPAVSVANKQYDGMTGAAVTSCTVSGQVGGDVVGCTAGSAAFDSAAVGTGKTVTVNGLTLTGAAAGNYTLGSSSATTTAAITARTATPSVIVANKAYDGTAAASIASCMLSGVVGGDIVGCTGSAAFDNANTGTGKTVTVQSLVLTGIAAGNYTLSSTTAATTGTITPRPVLPAATAANKAYDGTPNATLSGCTLSGVEGGDVVGCTGTATFDSASVGTGKTVTVSGLGLTGAAASNYSLGSTTATTTAAITAKTVTPSIAVGSRPYDGTATATVSNCTLSGVVSGHVVGCTGSATFDSTAVGMDKTVTVSGLTLTGPAAGNYALSSATATTSASISALMLAPSIAVASKPYDGLTSATVTSCTLSGVVGTDAVSCTGGTASFDTASVGTSKTVTVSGLALSGAAAGNYTLASTTATTTAAITALTLTPTVSVANKPYDGLTGATLTSCTLNGVVGTDAVSCTGGTASFDSASVGTSKTVTVSGLTLSGAAAGNYTLASTTATTTAAITAVAVTPVLSAGDKTYDGTTSAALTSCAVSGLIGGDVVTCTGTASFNTPDAGSSKTVRVTNVTLTGTAAGNYTLQPAGGEAQTLQEFTTTANIQPLTIAAAVTAANRTYDGTTAATLATCSLTGVVAGDVVTCAGTAAFETSGAGVGKTVTVTGLALAGADAANYVLESTTAAATATIEPRTATPVVTIANKLHDGTTAATITSCTVTGTIGADQVACTGTAAFESATAGSAKTVAVTGLALTGPEASNYALASTTTTATADIIQPNRAPVVTNPGAQAAYTGVATVLALAGSDADGDTLTWSAVNAPPGMTINPSTGAFSGTPTAIGTFAVVVSASDGTLVGQAAFTWSIASPIPGPATPLSPAGSTTTTAPSFSWSAVPLATYYALQINDASAPQGYLWYTPAQAGCASGTGTCTVVAPRTLQPGHVTWSVVTWNAYGYGPWSANLQVVIALTDATVPTPVAVGPSGSIATRSPEYLWNPVGGATWYQLSVTDAFGSVQEYWYQPSQACGPTSCAATPSVAIAAGPASWRVRAWRSTGAGAWSASMVFTPGGAAPAKVTSIAPAGSVSTHTPTFTWNATAGASYYLLRLTDRDKVSLDYWYTPSDAGCSAGTGVCSVTPGTTTKAGAANWQVLAWNASGYGPWSDTRDFVVDIVDPTALTPSTIAPAGAVTSLPITYRWNAVTGALSYRLSIRNNGGAPIYWSFTAAEAGCQVATQCTGAPPITMVNGTGEWQVQAWTANGHGAWSAPTAMTINALAPAAPVAISPSGAAGSKSPQLRWNASPNTSLYYVTVYDVTGLRVDKWLSPAQANCPTGGVCTLNVGVVLNSGTGSWRVLAWNPIGYSQWSSTMTMVIP